MKSYLSHLECTYCHVTFSADQPHRTCNECSKVLYPRYDLESAKRTFNRDVLKHRPASMWRYFELLPIRDQANIVSLGEGFTPTLKMKRLGEKIGCGDLYIKDESINPTASFKARGMSTAVSKALELGLTRLTVPSAGNAGSALAAYAARAGVEAYVFVPKDATEATKKEVEITGVELTLVNGLITDAGKLSRAKAEKDGLFDMSTLQEPYRVEGKKTMGYEIAEFMQWEVPDVILYPTGGGTGLVGIWKALQEMEELGWIDKKRPKMFCVQAENCAPMVRAFREGTEFAEPWQDAHTMAGGLRVPSGIADYLILQTLRESGGGAVTVSDGDMVEAMKEIASLEGMFICPEGAATLVGLKKLLVTGDISSTDSILLLNTGSGLKYLDLLK